MGKYASGDILRVSPKWLYQGVAEQVNTFHVRITGTVSSTDSDVEDDIEDWLHDVYEDVPLNVMSNDVEHQGTEILIEGSPYASSHLPADPVLHGQGGTDPVPPGLAGLLVAYTATRRVIGKKYLPSFTEAAYTNGAVNTASLAEMQQMADNWATPRTMASGLIITSVLLRQGTATFFVITSAIARTNPAYQRRRRIGSGR